MMCVVCVGQVTDLEKGECGADGRRADERRTDGATARAPVAGKSERSYAEALRSRARSPCRRVRFERKRRKKTPLTLKQ
jgi:hypothetical protein